MRPESEPQPVIETERLVLRPFLLTDCNRIAELAGHRLIAEMTANIPHPYFPSMAEQWVSSHDALYRTNAGVVYAITLKGEDSIIGAVSFPTLKDNCGLLGYWLGVPYWGHGYTTEAAKGLVAYSQLHFGLEKLQVMHLVTNDRSKSVIRKLGIPYIENRFIRANGYEREVCYYEGQLK